MQENLLGNRYELLEKIGEGGMAEVYKAKCNRLNRFVAIKILKKEFLEDMEFVKKFKREATAAASLSHNNIVNIYDVGSQGDINYIVFEYIKGKTLKQIIREKGKLDFNQIVEISIQIANALECAHKHNIIHRDIKPQNILITEEGIPKVADFGIAKMPDSVTITNSSKVMGSAHYFSPEQARGSYVDFRTDIYSLGVVIYEMATGKVPFDAESPVAIALKHLKEPLISPKEVNSNIPETLNKLICKTLEKDPIMRYQNVKDLIRDLERIKNNKELNIVTNNFDDDRTRIMDPIILEDKDKFYKEKFKDVEEEYDDYEDDYEDEDKYKKPKNNFRVDKKKKKLLTSIAIGVLVIAIAAISGYFIFNKIATSNSNKGKVEVPNIIGMKKEEAKEKIEEKGLKFVVIKSENSNRPEGEVIKCNHKVGEKVPRNSEIRVIVSEGEKIVVPNVQSMGINKAKNVINESGLQVGNISYEFSDTVFKGRVIRQTPGSDQKVNKDAVIDLVISNGRRKKITTVPNLQGKTLNEAKNSLYNAKLRVGNISIEDTTDKDLDGKIAKQSIEASNQVEEGTSINLVYYKYKKVEIDKPKKIDEPEEDESQDKDEEDENKDKHEDDESKDKQQDDTSIKKNNKK